MTCIDEARRARDERHRRARASAETTRATATRTKTLKTAGPDIDDLESGPGQRKLTIPTHDQNLRPQTEQPLVSPDQQLTVETKRTLRRAPSRPAPRRPPPSVPPRRQRERRAPPKRPPPRRTAIPEDNEQRKLLSQVALLQQQLAAAQRALKKSEKQKEELLAKLESSRNSTGNVVDDSAALLEQISALEAQLRAQQTGVDSDWDGSLDTAHEGMRVTMARLQDGDDRPEVIAEYEKWEKRVSTHPDHIVAEKRKMEEWERKEQPKRSAALAFIRRLLPPAVTQTTRAALGQQEWMTEPLLKRLWEKRVLWFVHMNERDVAKIHYADLKTKYSFHGCDITECRAVYAALPARFESECKVKLEWRMGLRDRLMQLGEQEDLGTLHPDDRTHPAYRSDRVVTPAPTAARIPTASFPPPPPPMPPSHQKVLAESTSREAAADGGRADLLAAIRARRVD